MKTKDLLSPIILIPVGLTFVTLSVLVFLSKGKNRKLIAAKMKVGALILTFSWFISCDRFVSTCFAAPEPNDYIYFENYNDTIQALDSIRGEIVNTTYQKFSYSILNKNVAVVNDWLPLYDESTYTKLFYVIPDSSLSGDSYTLQIFGESRDQIKRESLLIERSFFVK